MHTHFSLRGCRLIISALILTIPLITLAQIPENDDPCPTDANPPIDLTSTGNHTGTTCEATFDYANIDCSIETQDGSVWYTYTPSSSDDGYDITLSPAGGGNDAEGPITIELYKGTTNQGCSGFSSTIGSSCTAMNATIKIANTFDPGEVIYIKISTDEAANNCGEFNINIQPGSCGAFANNCTDITAAQTLSPSTPIDFDISYNCIGGCLDYASPDLTATAGCSEFTDNPTVWYKIDTDGEGHQLFTSVITSGNWQPVWSIYKGDDCGNLTIVDFQGQTCSNEDVTPDLFQVGIDQNQNTYWLAVTYDPLSIPITGIDDGTFEVCAATVINGIVCIGELEGDCTDPSLVIEVTDRELEGQSLDGPFCPGEEVTIHIEFFFDATETSADWLSGIVPRFGPGWDLDNFDFVANAPIGNGQIGGWYPEGEDCAALIQENVSHLCTYYDENGVFKLCNTFCEPCAECPTVGMSIDDPLPSGYYWVTNGGGSDCTNDCSPHEGWGIGSTLAQIDWDFTIRVKEFTDYEQCFSNNDLQISFQTFSQGILSCWEDPIGECLIDKSQFGPLWKVDCIIPPTVVAENQEICHDGVTDIAVSNQNGETNTIIVEVEDNPNVTGEMNHTFVGGLGTIQDNLFNTSNNIQIVTYSLYAEDLALNCPGPVTQLQVTVYPKLEASFPPFLICENECAAMTPDISGGFGGPYIYSWSTGASSSSINVCPVVPTTYFVTVEDALGCTGISEILVDVKPAVDILLPQSIEVCKDDSFDPINPDYIVCFDFLSGSSPIGVTWNAPPGLVGNPSGTFGECFTINEVATSPFGGNNGQYNLSVSVVDFFGCEGEADMIVDVTGELTLVLDVFELECGDTEVDIIAAGYDAVGNPITTFLLYGGCPEPAGDLGDFLEEITAPSGTGTFPTQDLLSYTCYSVVAQTAAGCQTMEQIMISLDEGTPIELAGTVNICQGEEATITILNAENFVSFEWTPNIGSTDSITFIPDSTLTYIVEATDNVGCTSQEFFMITVFDEDSPECSDPCENQTSEFQITGVAYSDDNANGIWDADETPLGNVQIRDVANDFAVFTNAFGAYSIPVSDGNVELTATINQGLWTSNEISNTVLVNIPCVEDINFGFVPFGSDSKVDLYMTNTITRCDWEVKFSIIVSNENHEVFDGRIEFTFDDKTSFFASDINGLQIFGNTASFETGPIFGFVPRVYEITLKMPGGTTNLPLLDFSASLFKETTLLDTYSYSEQLRCSYDPNDKRTFPDREGDENPTLKEEVMDYTIRFQNNGNDTAFHVRVVDVIDPSIIKSSIRFIGSSHPYEACISGDSLIVDFENIQLVDSMTNYDASQGFISFACNIDPDVEVDTEIFNSADIIFDTNPPIVTNTVLNTIVDMLCVNTEMDFSANICEGEEFIGYSETGNYSVLLTSELGCDSLINLDLTVISPLTTDLGAINFCNEDELSISIMGNDYELDSAGFNVIQLEGSSGCIEQIYTIDVSITEVEEVFEEFTICQGDNIEYEGEVYEIPSTGVYEFEIIGSLGCIEKVLNFDVSVIEPVEKFEEFTICEGDLIEYEGQEYEVSETGVYEFTILDDDGCIEQLLNFDVEVISIQQNHVDFQICEGIIVSYEGEEYEFDSSGTYSYFLQGPSGCDEIELIFDVTVYSTMYTTLDTTICEGQDYEGLEEAGAYTIELADPITGCPIFETVTLAVLPLSDPACITNIVESKLDEIEVFPIPASDAIIIKSAIQVENIVVYSTTGKIQAKKMGLDSREIKLDISQLPVGFHFLEIETYQGRVMKKIIVSR